MDAQKEKARVVKGHIVFHRSKKDVFAMPREHGIQEITMIPSEHAHRWAAELDLFAPMNRQVPNQLLSSVVRSYARIE